MLIPNVIPAIPLELTEIATGLKENRALEKGKSEEGADRYSVHHGDFHHRDETKQIQPKPDHRKDLFRLI